MEASKSRTKREAGNLALRFERPAEKGGAGDVVLSFQDGGIARKYVLGTIGPCSVKTELGPIAAFEFVPKKPEGKRARCRTMADVKQTVNRELFQLLVGAKDATVETKD